MKGRAAIGPPGPAVVVASITTTAVDANVGETVAHPWGASTLTFVKSEGWDLQNTAST